MAHLIQLRQRIKAIDTIKKITHAMRLIAMSAHTRQRSKEEPLKNYMNANKELFYTLLQQTKTWKHPFFWDARRN